MYGHDTKFNKLLIDFILDSDNGFDKRQHLFVTPYKNVYDNLKHYDNVVLDESGKNLYKIYYKHCNLIISHSSETLTRLIFTPKKIKNKIVYRYWGGLKLSDYKRSSINILENIKEIVKEYKKINIVTNHIEKFKKIEKQILEKEGIMLVISNNRRKSLLKSKIILNIDFPTELINKYQIYEEAIIVNLKGNVKIEKKRFNGININDYEICFKYEDEFDFEKKEKYNMRTK